MFGVLKKKKEIPIYAPMSGIAIPISEVPDEAFSEKMLGDGAAIKPDNGDIFSPVNGTITDITDTKHAFCITTDDGTDVLLHVGINTVNLKGEGFEVYVSSGDHIKAGTKLAKVDLELLGKYNIPSVTPVLFTETDKYEILNVNTGKVHGGEDVLFTYAKK